MRRRPFPRLIGARHYTGMETRTHYVADWRDHRCEPCQVRWRGPDHDVCWCCGGPPAGTHQPKPAA